MTYAFLMYNFHYKINLHDLAARGFINCYVLLIDRKFFLHLASGLSSTSEILGAVKPQTKITW